jgi:hypothetical protein
MALLFAGSKTSDRFALELAGRISKFDLDRSGSSGGLNRHRAVMGIG